MGNHYDPATVRYTDSDIPIFTGGMVGIEDRYAQGISKDGRSLGETDSVLAAVDLCFLGIPFKLDHSHSAMLQSRSILTM
jgi:hypothetical protein